MNPSFEEYYDCPTGVSGINKCKYVMEPVCGSVPSCISTPDYFNTCANTGSNVNVPNTFGGLSYREAKDGNAFIGIMNTIIYKSDGTFGSTNREFVQLKLSEPLVAGKQYEFSFFAGKSSATHIYGSEINQIGIHFVNDSIIYGNNTYLWHFMDPTG